MSECRSCTCGWTVKPARNIYSGGKWYVMCHRCVLSTRNYDTEEKAVNAWNNGRYSLATALIQRPITRTEDLDDDGCIELVKAIYNQAIRDYEVALQHPNIKEHSDKKYLRWKAEVENLYRYGFYTGTRMEDAGIDLLHKIIEERAEERRKNEEKAKEKERAADRARKAKKSKSRKKLAS